ncbi:MAG: oligosaccharide flippase family protein [Campylobacterota bacterium]|nr:oligosaccharide flippase family protein [Campylobacterota bacterium]
MISKIKSKFKSEDSKRLLSNFLSLLTLQGANYILPLLTLPYLVRVLGMEKFGLLAFAMATIIFFKIITEYGFHLTATRDIAFNRDNRDKIIEIFSAVMIIKFLLLLVSFMLLVLLVFNIEKFYQYREVYFLTFGTVIGQVLFPVWFFQGMERMKYITFLNILSKLIFTIAVFIFIQEESDFYIVPLLTSSGFIVAGILSLFIIRKEFNIEFRLQGSLTIKTYFKNGWNIFIVELLPNLYNNFSTFFLGFFVSMEMLGIYSLAIKIIDILNSFIRIMRNVTYPFLVNNISKFHIILKVMVSTGLLFTFLVISLSHLIIPYIFGYSANESILYLYILSLSPFFLAITFSYGSNRLLILKKDKEMKYITYQYSIYGFIVSLVLIPMYGVLGASITLISTRFLMSILTYKGGRLL